MGSDPPPLSDALWLRLQRRIVVSPSGCWLWTGATSKGRRGRRTANLRVGARWFKVHRLTLTWFRGAPPSPTHEGGHRCPGGPTSVCIHPDHLAWVTRRENEADKGRHARSA
jgi:hypothetical protein